ncbi:hypothetical protein [Helicobacter cholecystus]|uniref:hypothetical protein n=1 Tax=Helicobacter cholecystus TaxID=45498 RepID=UPI0027385F7B|nr:hypothetical protein [Helicobacter cholecystus]
MNKRFILSILGLGVIAIASLLGFCVYKMQTFKHKLQESLNTNLVQTAQELALSDIKLNYSTFECSGIFFIKCKSPYITFTPKGGSQELFSSKNLILSLKEIDFGSITLSASSKLEIIDLGELQEYATAFFPTNFELDFTIKPQNQASYTLHTALKLYAQNADYLEEFNSLIDSKNVQEMGIFQHISSFVFLNEGLKIKDFLFSLNSKGLSDKLFEIAQSKYGKSLNKQAYSALVSFLVGASLQNFSKKPYYPQIQEIIQGFVKVILGDANKMEIFISPQSNTSSYPLAPQDLEKLLNTLSSEYKLEVKLSK